MNLRDLYLIKPSLAPLLLLAGGAANRSGLGLQWQDGTKQRLPTWNLFAIPPFTRNWLREANELL